MKSWLLKIGAVLAMAVFMPINRAWVSSSAAPI